MQNWSRRSTGPRPFTIIDDGWQNKKAFPDMAALSASIRERKVRPGLWIRPLQAQPDTAAHLLLPEQRFGQHAGQSAVPAYDPTIPEALEVILAKVTAAVRWNYELVKHDFTTYELFGRWGSEMGAQPTAPGWSFNDPGKTNAEIVCDLYLAIRRTAGERTILIGCNTIGHLAAGVFEGQRTGDDVSGQIWERTRRMGVNTLAYRLPQHRAFFLVDADCVPITSQTPWSCNRQWLDLVARTGTILLASPEPAATGKEQRDALREAFRIVVAPSETATPVDWHNSTTPEHWKAEDAVLNSKSEHRYSWDQESGAWPFPV